MGTCIARTGNEQYAMRTARIVLLATFSGAALAPPSGATGYADARQLHAACTELAALTAGGQSTPLDDPCRTYLVDFFTAHKEAHDARLTAMLAGGALDPVPEPCFRPPDFVSFADLSSLIAQKGLTTPALLDAPSDALVRHALADAFPCSAPGDDQR